MQNGLNCEISSTLADFELTHFHAFALSAELQGLAERCSDISFKYQRLPAQFTQTHCIRHTETFANLAARMEFPCEPSNIHRSKFTSMIERQSVRSA